MQNVMCPTTMVKAPNWVAVATKNEASATPVITPGQVVGSVTQKLTPCLPGNE